jgi:hypothetical protein
MAAMRLFPQADFDAELRKAGLEPTDTYTAGKSHRLWKTKDGKFVTAPCHGGPYPDHVLDDLLRQVGRLYRPSGPQGGATIHRPKFTP